MYRKAREEQAIVEHAPKPAATHGRPSLPGVGKVAKRSGGNILTLRFYERSRLLDRSVRAESDYRLYTIAGEPRA